jgi:short-subunit dehydrogenase
VGLIARGEEDLSGLAGQLDSAVPLPCDVGDRESTARVVERFVEEAGGLEIAVANAGLAHWAPFTELDAARGEEMVRVNLIGTLNLVRAALPHMLDRGRGHVVVVSSSAALRAFPWTAVYSATKAGQKAFGEALRHELSGTGVSLTTVFPGEVRTSLHAHEMDRRPDWYRPGDAIPPEIVAEAIVRGIEQDRREVHVPGQVRLLALNDLAPGLIDRLLALLRGGAAAPRRY